MASEGTDRIPLIYHMLFKQESPNIRRLRKAISRAIKICEKRGLSPKDALDSRRLRERILDLLTRWTIKFEKTKCWTICEHPQELDLVRGLPILTENIYLQAIRRCFKDSLLYIGNEFSRLRIPWDSNDTECLDRAIKDVHLLCETMAKEGLTLDSDDSYDVSIVSWNRTRVSRPSRD